MRVINLLPKYKREELRYEEIWHSLIILIYLSIASFGVVFLVQIGAKFYLQYEAKNVADQIISLKAQVSKQNNKELKDQITTVNNFILDYSNLANAAPKWSKLLKDFSSVPPQGIYITSFQADAVNKVLTISGHGATRDLVISLYNNILNDKKDFVSVNYPLDNIAKPDDINFHFTIVMQDSVLH